MELCTPVFLNLDSLRTHLPCHELGPGGGRSRVGACHCWFFKRLPTMTPLRDSDFSDLAVSATWIIKADLEVSNRRRKVFTQLFQLHLLCLDLAVSNCIVRTYLTVYRTYLTPYLLDTEPKNTELIRY